MATISSLGTGSGLDLNTLLTNLMTAERSPLVALQSKATSYQTRLTSLGSMKSALFSLQTATAGLMPGSTQTALAKFSTYSASVADTSVATASMTSGAVAGSYSLNVTNVASAQQLSKSFSALSVPTGAGTLAIKVGTASAVDVAIAAGSTLANVATAINNSSAGITATVVNDGTSDHLLMTAKDSGVANTIAITGSGTGWGVFDRIAGGSTSTPSGGWTATDPASALLTVNGIAVTSASNTLTTAVSGVTLNLVKAGATTLTVNKDSKASLTTALNAFVTAYNTANTTMTTLGAYDPTTKAAGALQGDSTLRIAQSQLRGQLFGLSAQQISKSAPAVPATAGSLSIQVGTSAAVNVAIAANSTLAMVSTAINGSSAGVRAAIVTSGSTNQLLLTSKLTGQLSAISMSASGDASWVSSGFNYSATTANGWTSGLVDSATNSGTSAYQRLSDIGVSLAKDGTLSLDSTKLSNAVSADFSTVANLVASFGTAYKTNLGNTIGTTGSISSAITGANSRITSNQKAQAALTSRLAAIETRYRAQFTSLDTLIAGLKSSSSYLTQQLDSLANLTASFSK